VTLFEYLSVATSIVLSLSAAQLLTNLRSVLDPSRRYWVHTLWTFFALFVHLIIWWEFWGYRDVASWNLVKFSLMLLNPGILLFCSSTLVHPESETSWDKHYFAVRRSFLGAMGMLPLVSMLRRWAVADLPLLSSANFPEVLFAMLSAAGFVSGNRRVQEALVLIFWFTIIFTSGSTWFRPGEVVS
jgi:hypothetical protein